MPVSAYFNAADAMRFLPEIILTIAATLLMVLDPLLSKASKAFGSISIVALLSAMGAAIYNCGSAQPIFGGLLMDDCFALFFRLLVMLVGILAILLPFRFLARQRGGSGRVSLAHPLLRRRPVHHGLGQ